MRKVGLLLTLGLIVSFCISCSDKKNAENSELDSKISFTAEKMAKVFDAYSEWSDIIGAIQDDDSLKQQTFVVKYGFSNVNELKSYFQVGTFVGYQLSENPNDKDSYVKTYGKPAIDVILLPDNISKIKEFSEEGKS